MTGWLFIVLSSATSVLIAHFLKVVEFKKLSTIKVLIVNYLAATIIAFSTSGATEILQLDFYEFSGTVTLAMVTGLFFIVNFFIYSKSVFHNGVGISVASMRISLIIPVLLSTLWYLELLTVQQWMGVLFVIFALFLLLPNKRKMLREPFSAAWLLVLLFICTGIGDASLKVYEREFSALLEKEQFMGLVFFIAFMIGIIFLAFRKERSISFSWAEVGMGIAIGIPNFYTSIFLIEALERMNGGIVYSSVNLLTVLGGTLLGITRWQDKLTGIQWIGIIISIAAIVLLL
jgi:drug/metabolite transporter (DMT)-like permease